MDRQPPASFSLEPDRPLPSQGVAAAPACGVYRIVPGRAARFVMDRPVRMMVWSGRLWLTRHGDQADHFVAAGRSLVLGAGEDVVVEADTGVAASFSIVVVGVGLPSDPRARPDPRDRSGPESGAAVGRLAAGFGLAGLARRLFTAWRRQRQVASLASLSSLQLRDIGLDPWTETDVWQHRDHAARLAAAQRFDLLR